MCYALHSCKWGANLRGKFQSSFVFNRNQPNLESSSSVSNAKSPGKRENFFHFSQYSSMTLGPTPRFMEETSQIDQIVSIMGIGGSLAQPGLPTRPAIHKRTTNRSTLPTACATTHSDRRREMPLFCPRCDVTCNLTHAVLNSNRYPQEKRPLKTRCFEVARRWEGYS